MAKSLKILVVLICTAFLLVGCQKEKNGGDSEFYFNAKVMEVNRGSLLLEVIDSGNSNIAIANQVSIANEEGISLVEKDYVKVVFDGKVMESYPLQLGKIASISKIEVSENVNSIVEVIDKSKEPGFACAMALEKFYEDDQYEYYFECIKSSSIIVKYEDGSEKTIKEALENKDLLINDLADYDITYIKEEK